MVEEDREQEEQQEQTEDAEQTPINRATPRRIITARRKQLAEQQKNLKQRRLIIGISSAAILLVIGAIVAGYIVVFVLPPSQLVVRVDDVSYSRGDMVELMRIKQRQSEFLGTELNLSDEVFRSLQILLENEIIQQVAPSYGINVSDEEVDSSIRFLLEPRLGYSTDPNQRELEFRETYRTYLNWLGISEAEHRKLTRTSLMREKFRIYIGDTVPRVADQIHLHQLVMVPGDEIDIMQTKFADFTRNIKDNPAALSEAFRAIVREFSRDDADVIRAGGDIGWVPEGVKESFDYAIFSENAMIGELIGPLNDPDLPRRNFYFMISEKAEERVIDPHNRNILMTGALQDWLNVERDNHEVYALMDSNVHNWVIKQLGITSRVTPTPRPNLPFLQGF